MMQHDISRRLAPRLDIHGFCSELTKNDERHGFVTDISATGVRIERPYRGGGAPESIQLEFELPAIDEVIWARGEVCFSHLKSPKDGLGALVLTSGIRLAAAATRDLKVLRDYVQSFRRRPLRPEVAMVTKGWTGHCPLCRRGGTRT